MGYLDRTKRHQTIASRRKGSNREICDEIDMSGEGTKITKLVEKSQIEYINEKRGTMRMRRANLRLNIG
jgi:hypothetical protein